MAPELRKLGAPLPKLKADFSAEELAVIRERRQYQSGVELADVFGTTWRVIAAICRES